MSKRSERRQVIIMGGRASGKIELHKQAMAMAEKINETLCPPEGTIPANDGAFTPCPQDYTPPAMTPEYEAKVKEMQNLWLGVLRHYQPVYIIRQRYSL